MKERDNHPADIISREILSKGKKALVIYGAAHMGLFGANKYFNLRAQIDAKQPGAWFVVCLEVSLGALLLGYRLWQLRLPSGLTPPTASS